MKRYDNQMIALWGYDSLMIDNPMIGFALQISCTRHNAPLPFWELSDGQHRNDHNVTRTKICWDRWLCICGLVSLAVIFHLGSFVCAFGFAIFFVVLGLWSLVRALWYGIFGLRSLLWNLWFRIFVLISLVRIGIFRFGIFALRPVVRNLWFGSFGLCALVWDLWFGIFCLCSSC